jgi:hypothetical protein
MRQAMSGELVVVGALGKDHLRHAVSQRAEGRACSAVMHDRAGRREQLGLRDEAFDPCVRGEGCQFGGILIASDGHHHVDWLVSQRFERNPEKIEVVVEESPEVT